MERRAYDLKYPSIVRSGRASGNDTFGQSRAYYQPGKNPDTRASSSASGAYCDAELRNIRQRIADLNTAVQSHQRVLQEKQSELSNLRYQLRISQSILQRMDEEERKDVTIAAAGWYDWIFKYQETVTEKADKERRALERTTVRRVQNLKVLESTSKIRTVEGNVQFWERSIKVAEIQRVGLVQREKERLEEIKRVEFVRQERERKAEQERKDIAAQKARQEQERQREKQEAARRAELVRKLERQRREAEAEEAERQRRGFEAQRAQIEAERRRREVLYAKIDKAASAASEEKQRNEQIDKNEADKVATPNPERRSYPPQKQDAGQKKQTTVPSRRRPPPPPPSGGPAKKTCQHDRWWPKVMGQFVCERCSVWTLRFAFRCPSCSIVACANCRNAMKN